MLWLAARRVSGARSRRNEPPRARRGSTPRARERPSPIRWLSRRPHEPAAAHPGSRSAASLAARSLFSTKVRLRATDVEPWAASRWPRARPRSAAARTPHDTPSIRARLSSSPAATKGTELLSKKSTRLSKERSSAVSVALPSISQHVQQGVEDARGGSGCCGTRTTCCMRQEKSKYNPLGESPLCP